MGRTQQSILSFFGKPRVGARPSLRGGSAAATPGRATAGHAGDGNGGGGVGGGVGGGGSGGGAPLGGWGAAAASRSGRGGVAASSPSLATDMDDDMPDDAQLLATLEMVERYDLWHQWASPMRPALSTFCGCIRRPLLAQVDAFPC